MPSESNKPIFLSTISVSPADRRLAYALLAMSALALLCLAPFARIQLAAVPAFIPSYQSALVASDLITAVLLFGQFNILRQRALLVLACGYLFAAAIAFVHMLTFPGAFAPTGMLGAGPQTTAWLYMAWHGVFPLCLVIYALLKNSSWDQLPLRVPPVLASCAAAAITLALVGLFALLATAGQSLLPDLMVGNRYASIMWAVVLSVWTCSLAALVLLWRRQSTLLDLWLTVVMCAWLCDIALSALLNGGRYDLGFYAGRLYGFIACGFVLLMLLLENGALYSRLVDAHAAQQKKNDDLERLGHKLVEANRLLVGNNLKLREASQHKSEFLSHVSHELRTPLTAVIGFASTLRMRLAGPINEMQERQLASIEKAGRHLLSLINDLLDLSKIEAGKVDLDLQAVDCKLVLHELSEIMAPLAEKKGLEIRLDLREEQAQAWADRRAVQQILLNLVNNAIKFTEHGSVVLTVADSQMAEKPGIAISVQDSGVGISAEDQDRLFQPYSQVGAGGAKRAEGTGLGLHLSRKLATLLGGRLECRSEYGKGSCFTLTLAAADAAEIAEAAANVA